MWSLADMNEENLQEAVAEAEAAAEAEILTPAETSAIMKAPHEAALRASISKTVAPAMSAQQARVQEVTDALAPAYLKASTLELSDAEIEALQAIFPDCAVEIRPHDGLIWIPHIHISNRLNKVFRPGKWATICRRHWVDRQTIVPKVKGEVPYDISTMYGEYVLVVRGCFVGESIGGHPYQPNNPKTNFSDALESTRAEALRRICGKTLGCGSQVWDPSYSREWVQKYAFQQHGKWQRKALAQEPSHPPASHPPRQSGTPSSAHSRAAAGQSTPQQAPTPARAQSAPGQACPKCRGTATKKSQDWEGVQFCQRCGWQWDLKTGQYFEGQGRDWLRVICTMPPKGVPMQEYKQNPQTLGQISRIDNKRWYGIVMNNTEAEQRKGWTSPKTGQFYPATDAQLAFGRACEEAANYLEEQRQLKEQGGRAAREPDQTESDGAGGIQREPEEDVPF
jgi:hypothetical protein